MNKIRGFFPMTITVVISISRLGVIFLLEENKNKILVVVNWGQSVSEVGSYMERKNLDPTAINLLMNESSDVVRAYTVRGTPTHLVIDKKGDCIL